MTISLLKGEKVQTETMVPLAFRMRMIGVCMLLGALSAVAGAQEESGTVSAVVDPVTRYFRVSYAVPEDAPVGVSVVCTWSPAGAEAWRPARVLPFVSETALRLAPEEDWKAWAAGCLMERRAAGLWRTVLFNPYPDAWQEGRVEADFRIEIRSGDDALLQTHTVRVSVDLSDVVYLEDWSQVFQKDAVSVGDAAEAGQWCWRTDLADAEGMSLGNGLHGDAGPETGLRMLSYPLDLRGWYAIYVRTPGTIRLRLTGDEQSDLVSSRPGEEVLWRWVRMDRQHLVIEQPHRYTGYAPAALDYVKLVPLNEAALASLEAPFAGVRDRFVAGYWEPYSAAFHDHVTEALWHRRYLGAYPEAGIDLADMQIGRFGMKVVYESRLTDNLYYATRGDPIGTVARPETDNVGRMQQYTNTLETSIRHARELGVRLHANFGASNCYPGSPLQGDFSKAHPEWMRGSALRYEVPEVRAYALSLYREALEIGAEGVSLDFCRYPETIDTVETCNLFLKELRALADEFEAQRGERVPVLVRFPATGVRRNELFDYAAWAREGWVDYLCPSNIQGRHLHFDIGPYLAAVKGTGCTLLPCTDGLGWGLPFPGPFLWRVAQLYEAGVPGLYIYQADARIFGRPKDRRTMRLLCSAEAVARWWEEDARLRPLRSKGIYITGPQRVEGYAGWHRLRCWLEGIPMGEVEWYLDGTLVGRQDGPPYLLGTEDYATDKVIPPGKHEVLIRARDGAGWLEQRFAIVGAG